MYLEALATLPDLHIHYGYHVTRERRCSNCGILQQTYEEKMTDVNIAVELLGDAQDDAFDTAIVMSGDGDLASPVRAVRDRFLKGGLLSPSHRGDILQVYEARRQHHSQLTAGC